MPRGPATRHIGAGAYVLCLCNGSCHQAPTDRARWRLLHGARRRPTQGACSSLPLALRWRVLAARSSHQTHRCRCLRALPLQRKPPSSSDRSSKVAAAPRCEAEADSRCVLASAAGAPSESACRQDHTPATVGGFAFATEAAMKLRLIEQACRCSTVRGRGRLKVRARLCRWHYARECLPPGPVDHTPAVWFAFVMHTVMKL